LFLFLDHAVDQRFMKQVHREMIHSTDSIQRLIDYFRNYKPIITDKWIDIK
jgi:predicted Rossmann-fold nucleotide-binding protein